MLYIFLPFIFGVLLLLQIYRSSTKTAHHLLPSPGLSFPIIGHFHHVIKGKGMTDPVTHLWELYKKHGKSGILRIKALTNETVFIGDHKLLTKLFTHPDVQGRSPHKMLPLFNEFHDYRGNDNDTPGIIFAQGKTWSEQRRFSQRTLRDFGLGKAGMEVIMAEELDKFSAYIKTFGRKPLNIADKLNLPSVNLLWYIAAGEKFDYDNPKFLSIDSKLADIVKHLDSPKNTIISSFPWMSKIGFLRRILDRDLVVGIFHGFREIVEDAIKEHEKTIIPGSSRDYIDACLNNIHSTTDVSSTFYGKVGRDNLIASLADLFGASNTTSTALTWSMLYMVIYPDVQKKVQEEIREIVGNNRMPSLEDKPNMPYTEAVMWESFRMGNPGPYSFQHVTTKDVIANGYTIPADTLVMGLITEMNKGDHHEDPFSFKPERFIDSDGKFAKPPSFIPFGTGKRMCMGDTLAKAQYFIFFAGLLQKFTFLPENPDNPPNDDSIPGIVCIPKQFKVIAVENTHP